MNEPQEILCSCGGNLIKVNIDDLLDEFKCLCYACQNRRIREESKTCCGRKINCPWCTLPHDGECDKSKRDYVRGKRNKGKNKPSKESLR